MSHALSSGRRMAESRMTETVTVGKYEWVSPTGTLGPPVLTLIGTAVYTGKARVKFPSASAQVKSPAGQQVAETNVVVFLPAGSVSVPTGMSVKVTASTVDPVLVNRVFRVDGPAQAGQTTAHRYPVVEET